MRGDPIWRAPTSISGSRAGIPEGSAARVGGFCCGRLGREMKACYGEGAQLMNEKDEN